MSWHVDSSLFPKTGGYKLGRLITTPHTGKPPSHQKQMQRENMGVKHTKDENNLHFADNISKCVL